jgi:hypothetical protein
MVLYYQIINRVKVIMLTHHCERVDCAKQQQEKIKIKINFHNNF